MNFTKTEIPDVILIEPKLNEDFRGYFLETFRQKEFDNFIGYEIKFCQENETKSNKGVLRGLHFQIPPFSQSKLVRVIEGEVLDVAVDIRLGSPTFGQHVLKRLNSINKQSLFIPRGFAHGFLVLSEWAIFSYKVDNYYSPKHESGLIYNDPTIGIDWYLPNDAIRLSDKDLSLPSLSKNNIESFKIFYENNSL